jgi:hypothetical protein
MARILVMDDERGVRDLLDMLLVEKERRHKIA